MEDYPTNCDYSNCLNLREPWQTTGTNYGTTEQGIGGQLVFCVVRRCHRVIRNNSQTGSCLANVIDAVNNRRDRPKQNTIIPNPKYLQYDKIA